MQRRVLALISVHCGLAAVLWFVAGESHTIAGAGIDPGAVLVAGAAFAVVGLFPVHVDLGRHAFFVNLVESVLILALLNTSPATAAAAAVAGELAAGAIKRRRPLKVVFNASATLWAVTLAALAMPVLPQGAGWSLLAVAAYAVAGHTSTSAVLAVAEGRRFEDVFRAPLLVAVGATSLSACFGLVAHVLFTAEPSSTLLVVPLLATVLLTTRLLAAQRAERLRFERLYAASARTSGLQEPDRVLATLADEARGLVTGAVGLCCVDGLGVVVDDQGFRPASSAAIDAAVRLAGDGPTEKWDADIPAPLTTLLPDARAAVAASADGAVLVVLRDVGPDGEDGARREVLAAFAGHAALATANARLYAEQVDLNRQKDDFVAVVSHELRTPLTSMVGSVATLRRRGSSIDDERREALLEMAERQGLRLRRLIEDLLLVAATDDRSALCLREPIELPAFLEELAFDLGPQSAGRLKVMIAPGPATLLTDGLKLRQVFVNLVENAIKYAPDGEIDLVAAPAGPGAIAISVRDHGPGISPEHRSKAFERFVQLDQSSTRRQGGTGLGLYLCRQLATLLGGRLELDDTPGGGCTFTLVLPIDHDRTTSADQSHRAIADEQDERHDDLGGMTTLRRS